MNIKTCITSNGDSISLLSLVTKYWPNKKVIYIDENQYNMRDDVSKLFHISIYQYDISYSNPGMGVYISDFWYGVIVQRGKTGRHTSKALYGIILNYPEIENNILAERLEYSVKSLQDVLYHFKDGDQGRGSYKTEYIREILSTCTLYVKQSQLESSISEPQGFAGAYKYDFKIVTDEEWAEVVRSSKANSAFIEFIGNEYGGTIIYKADDGKLLAQRYPWINYHGKMKASIIRKTT